VIDLIKKGMMSTCSHHTFYWVTVAKNASLCYYALVIEAVPRTSGKHGRKQRHYLVLRSPTNTPVSGDISPISSAHSTISTASL